MARSKEAIEASVDALKYGDGPSLTKDPIRAMRRAIDAADAVDGNPVDVRTVTAYESGVEAGKDAAGNAQWRQIETAPKDGTDILVYCPLPGSEYIVVARFSVVWVDSYEAEDIYEPTHWVPLPSPPSSH